MSTKMSCCNLKSGGDCDRCGDMISVQKCVINIEGNEASEASRMSNLTGGKTETNLPNQLEVFFCQDLNGSLDGLAQQMFVIILVIMMDDLGGVTTLYKRLRWDLWFES